MLRRTATDGDQYLVGVAQNGRPFAIARNALNTAELAGVTFSDDQRTLFGNIYAGTGGGLSFAIRGPWTTVSPPIPRATPAAAGTSHWHASTCEPRIAGARRRATA